jgi:hypothetical protein
MRSLYLFAACALAACHSKAGFKMTPPPTRMPYMPLFIVGNAWKLPLIEANGTRSNITCRVADSKPIGDATVAHLACDPPHAGLLVVGTWVATPAGLYHPLVPVDEPDELALLGEDDLLIAANAVEHEHTHKIDQADDEIEAFVFEGSWCVRETTATTEDRRSYTLCFDGRALMGGGESVGKGTAVQQVRFGMAPADDGNETAEDSDKAEDKE